MRSLLKLLACLALVAVPCAAATAKNQGLKCSAAKIGPLLDVEFRFLAGSWFSLPVKQFWGDRIDLYLKMIVEPAGGTSGSPKIVENEFKARHSVPEGMRGEINFSSGVSVGTGSYQVYWQIRDARGRTCEGTNQFKAALRRKDRAVELSLEPGEIVDTALYLFRPLDRLERPRPAAPRRMKIFLSMDVLGRRGRVVRTRMFHLMPHVAALRRLATSSNFDEFSVVAFSFEDQKVVIHQDYRRVIDFPAMRDAVKELHPETVDVGQLVRGSEMQFFENLLVRELLRVRPPEAVVFLGQDLHFGKRLPNRVLDSLRQIGAVVSFLDASRFAWRGAMGNVVQAIGGKEHRLQRPSDLARAIASFEDRVLRSRPQ